MKEQKNASFSRIKCGPVFVCVGRVFSPYPSDISYNR